MMSETKSLGDALPEEIARVTKLLGQYIAIGPDGTFGAIMIRASLASATRALAEGDVIAMITAFQDLQAYSG